MSLTSYRAAPPRVSGCICFGFAFKQITPRLEDAALDVWGVILGNMMLLYLEGPAVTYSPVP